MKVAPVNVLSLAHILATEGHDAAALLSDCGLPPFEAIDEDGEWLALEVFERMMNLTIARTGNPCFGLVAGKSVAQVKYGMITAVVLNTPSFRQMLADIAHLSQLWFEAREIVLEEGAERACIQIDPVVSQGAAGRLRTEQVATSVAQMLLFAGARPSDLYGVEFPYPIAPEHLPHYSAIFGPQVKDAAQSCRLHFSRALLDTKLASHDPLAYEAALARAQARLRRAKARNGVADQVRLMVMEALPLPLSLEEAARRLQLSDRQLRRQLSALGTNHAQLVQECLRLRADQLLCSGKLPIKQVADQLGFGSVPTFYRAFKRWYGVTPSEWRQP